MWVVSKFKKKEYEIFHQNLKKRYSDIKIYVPKINIKIKNSDKYQSKFVLGNYVFIYHEKFLDKKITNSLQNLKGLECVLSGFQYNQNEIKKFIYRCEKFKDQKGFLTQGFFSFNDFKNKGYFVSGPFSRFIFDILEKQKKQLKISLANIKITLNKNSNCLFCPSV